MGSVDQEYDGEEKNNFITSSCTAKAPKRVSSFCNDNMTTIEVKNKSPKKSFSSIIGDFKESEIKSEIVPKTANIKINQLFKKSFEETRAEIQSIQVHGDWSKGLKGSVVLACISTFQENVNNLSVSQMSEFKTHVQYLLDYCENNEDIVRNSHAESISGCILLLVASHLGVGKKDFIAALAPMKKRMFGKVQLIKKASVYQDLKTGYSQILSTLKNRA